MNGETPLVEDPPGFVVRTEAQKAAFDNGFRLERGVTAGWIGYASTTARGDIWIAGVSPVGPWLLSVSHPGVAAELGHERMDRQGPGCADFVFASLSSLHDAVERAYKLGVSLPDAPLDAFQKQTQQMPRTTEVERLAVQRVGQDVFRKALMAYWGGRCPMTGVSDPALLRASHIVPWADCDSDAQRLDVHNGLLLSALWDAAFDAALVSFTNEGEVIVSPSLAVVDRQVLLGGAARQLIGLTPKHSPNLARHRAKLTGT